MPKRRRTCTAFAAAATVALLLALALASSQSAQAQAAKPAIEEFRFTPARVCIGDKVQYVFTYKNFPGGHAAAVKTVKEFLSKRFNLAAK